MQVHAAQHSGRAPALPVCLFCWLVVTALQFAGYVVVPVLTLVVVSRMLSCNLRNKSRIAIEVVAHFDKIFWSEGLSKPVMWVEHAQLLQEVEAHLFDANLA